MRLNNRIHQLAERLNIDSRRCACPKNEQSTITISNGIWNQPDCNSFEEMKMCELCGKPYQVMHFTFDFRSKTEIQPA